MGAMIHRSAPLFFFCQFFGCPKWFLGPRRVYGLMGCVVPPFGPFFFLLQFFRFFLFPRPPGEGARQTSTQPKPKNPPAKSRAFFFCKGDPMPRPAEPYP